MKSRSFNPKDFGLKEHILYEVLATTFLGYKDEEVVKPNTACLGIRLTERDQIKIWLFPKIKTLENIRANGLITINFVDNVYLYALAALKDQENTQGIIKFSDKYYNSLEIDIPAEENSDSVRLFMPYIMKSWGALFCKVVEGNQIIKKDRMGKTEVVEFLLEIIHFNKIKETFKLFNRAENLALEALILATKLPVAHENNQKEEIMAIKINIDDYIDTIERFGRNKKAINTIRVIQNFIKTHNY